MKRKGEALHLKGGVTPLPIPLKHHMLPCLFAKAPAVPKVQLKIVETGCFLDITFDTDIVDP